jgi:hypothetical protein
VIQSLTLEPRGPFSLRAAAEFAFGPSSGSAPRFDGGLRLAFGIDGGDGYAGVVVPSRSTMAGWSVRCTPTAASSR